MASAPHEPPVAPPLDHAQPRHNNDERYRLLVEGVKDYAIFILDPHGCVSTWNAGAQRIKGYVANEIIGKHFSIFYSPDVVASGHCECALQTVAREGHLETEGWRVRRDGARFWASVTIAALRDPDGTLLGFAKVTRDLTERKHAEEETCALAAQKAVIAENLRVQEFQECFLGLLGHDLRNPLAAMDMGAAVLRQRTNDPAQLRILERMHSSSRRMSRMIEQILDLTRSHLGGGLEIHPEPMDLRAALTRVIDELRSAHPSHVIELRSGSVHGIWDRDRLERVFSNLIGNAILHGNPTTPVSITAQVDTEIIRVVVHNEGPPIPETLRDTLFDPFRRSERETRTSKTAGLGLGLYISHELIRAHGGILDFESTARAGTTFRVTLPIRSPAFDPSTPISPARAAPQGREA